MHTFVLVANSKGSWPQAVLNSCQRILKRWMPTVDAGLRDGQTTWPECNCGWLWLAPANPSPPPLVSEAIAPRYAVVAFGDVWPDRSAAQAILSAWQAGGASQVRELEGCFSAAILDRANREVVLLSDVAGQRTLRYYANQETLIASPHDIALVASGLLRVQFDLASAASIISLGWSLGDKSLLAGVETCHPAEYIRWSDGCPRKVAAPILDHEQRIDRRDLWAISRTRESVIEITRKQLQALISQREEITFELSAGVDSRTVLSLLLSVAEPSQTLKPICDGQTNSTDVRVARRLAKIYGLALTSREGIPPTPEEFIEQCDLLAFATNGGANSNHFFLKPQAGFDSDRSFRLHGYAGELFRGYFYPQAPWFSRSPLSPAEVFSILSKKSRIDDLPWQAPELANAVLARLEGTLERYSAISADGYDILDLYNLYEAYAVRGAARQRITWRAAWGPFFSRQAIRLLFTLPSPACDYLQFHNQCLRRFTPRAYWIRVNGRKLQPIEYINPLARLLKSIDGRYRNGVQHLQRALHLDRPPLSQGIEELRAAALAGPLKATAWDILTTKGSLALECFGKHSLEQLFNEPLRNQNIPLSVALTLERWHRLVLAVAHEAEGTFTATNS